MGLALYFFGTTSSDSGSVDSLPSSVEQQDSSSTVNQLPEIPVSISPDDVVITVPPPPIPNVPDVGGDESNDIKPIPEIGQPPEDEEVPEEPRRRRR